MGLNLIINELINLMHCFIVKYIDICILYFYWTVMFLNKIIEKIEFNLPINLINYLLEKIY